MSQFYKYGEKFDAKARKAFAEFRKAEKGLAEAKAAADKYPQRHGIVTAEYANKSAVAHAALLVAQEEYKTALQKFKGYNNEFAAMRNDLANDVAEAYRSKPEHLKNETLELLKSGTMSVYDYETLLAEAQRKNNATMVKIIGKYAGERAAEFSKGGIGSDIAAAQQLRGVEAAAKQFDGHDHMESWDALASIFERCTNNPAMIDHWDELATPIVDEF